MLVSAREEDPSSEEGHVDRLRSARPGVDRPRLLPVVCEGGGAQLAFSVVILQPWWPAIIQQTSLTHISLTNICLGGVGTLTHALLE